MTRLLATLSVLLSFILAQFAFGCDSSFYSGISDKVRPKKTATLQKGSPQTELPIKSVDPDAVDDESDDSPQDPAKNLVSPLKVSIIFNHEKLAFIDAHFTRWLLIEFLERPPKTLA